MSTAKNENVPKTSDAGEVANQGWPSLDGLRLEIDRLFEDFRPFGRRWPATRSALELDLPGFKAGWSLAPAMDLVEKEKEYEITAELPGLDKDHVKVKISNRMLTIKGDKKEEKEEKRKDYFLSERRFGSFQRSFRIPDGVDPEGIEADFTKGVLTVRLPKTAEAQQTEKKIVVKAK
ncbi:MAG: Hsp20/alpha crystallin family protein [Microvirga sp.]|nr:Hsp20/alpha crystallin family protein [Microvirga sp.]